ncbi:MAG: FISUMP domain-containing protein, partial [Prolixibacteraceae bacterium]
MKKNIFTLLMLLLVLISCVKREWINPFSADCPKEMWTPTNFSAVQEGNNVKLTWSQPLTNISGFKITKSVGGATATSIQDQSKSASILTDNTLIGGKVHLYSITAYAGNNTSNTVTVQVTPILTAGITTTAVSAITSTSLTSGGTISTDGGAAIIARGVCWNTTANPTIANSKTTDGTGTGSFISSVTGLTPGATYYFRAYAINSIGTSYGNEVTTVTAANLPVLTTTTVSAVTATNATSGGVISSDGGGAITARGVCWSTTANPTIANSKTSDGTGIGTFASAITGLASATTYYVRAYSTNSAGTAYGNEVSFKTTLASILFNSSKTYGTITDIDGNVYKTVQIGTQNWMSENLRTTKYKDGTAIPLVTDNNAWANLTAPGYCWYNNDETTYSNTFGALYNGYTVNTSKVCPTGWHVPTDAECTILSSYLGGTNLAGGKLKETGTNHWPPPNTEATNESGFTAVPIGMRSFSGSFGYIGKAAYWWSCTDSFSTSNWIHYVGSDNNSEGRTNSTFQNGVSIRCISGELALPTLITNTISGISSNSATSGGTISSDGGTAITTRGVCWSTTTTPTIANSKTSDGTGSGTLTSSITGLAAGTTYYVRAYATNSAGTGYGNEVSFKTEIAPIIFNSNKTYGSMSDVDGNTYKTVQIGTQLWMAENLKTTKFKDGTGIPLVTDNSAWVNLITPGYCWYSNDIKTYKDIFGALYNWYTVQANKLCPTGWHTPTVADLKVLTDFIGGENVAGGKLKEIGLTHWLTPNNGADNESGYTGIPSGYRDGNGIYSGIGGYGSWWLSNNYNEVSNYFNLGYLNISSFQSLCQVQYGYSVRCIYGELTIPTITTT